MLPIVKEVATYLATGNIMMFHCSLIVVPLFTIEICTASSVQRNFPNKLANWGQFHETDSLADD